MKNAAFAVLVYLGITIGSLAITFWASYYLYTEYLVPDVSAKVNLRQDTQENRIKTLEKSLAESQEKVKELKILNQSNQFKFESYVDREENELPRLNKSLDSCYSANAQLKHRIQSLKKTINDQTTTLNTLKKSTE